MMKHDRHMTDLASVRRRARGRVGAARKAESLIRQDAAQKLALAIYAAHPEDARQILTAALDDLNRYDGCSDERGKLAEDARFWTGRSGFWRAMPALRGLILQMTGAGHE